MPELTYEQKLFLREHKIPLTRVFDATGMSASAYEEVMRGLGMWVAYGVTPCRNAGHQLRLRSGHCFQCAPAGISYLKRHDEDGEIYVAYSKERNLVKIGSAKDSLDRIKNLNAYKYGGAKDWCRFYAVSSNRAGLIEISTHQALCSYSVDGSYIKGGFAIASREVFSCSIDEAVNTIKKILLEYKQKFVLIQDYVINKRTNTMDEKKPDAPPPISNDNDEFEVDWKLTKISLAVQEDRVLKATGIDSLQNSNQTPVKPMEKNSVTPPPVKNIDSLLARYLDLRRIRAERKRNYQADDLADLREQENIEAEIYDIFDKTGIKSIQTDHGFAYKSKKKDPVVNNLQVFCDYVSSEKITNFGYIRLTRVFLDEFITKNGAPPPGVDANEKEYLGIRAPLI